SCLLRRCSYKSTSHCGLSCLVLISAATPSPRLSVLEKSRTHSRDSRVEPRRSCGGRCGAPATCASRGRDGHKRTQRVGTSHTARPHVYVIPHPHPNTPPANPQP